MGQVHPSNPTVVISYSHEDGIAALKELLVHLKPLKNRGLLDAWSDEDIIAGQVWREDIANALASAKVAVLLVTPAFLASDFIAKNELPPLLKAAERGNLTILWVPVSASNYKFTELDAFVAAYPPDRPLDGLRKSQRQKALVEISEKIRKAAELQKDIDGTSSGGKVPWGRSSSEAPQRFELRGAAMESLQAHRVNEKLVQFAGSGELWIMDYMIAPMLVKIEAGAKVYQRIREGFLSGELDSFTGTKWSGIGAVKSGIGGVPTQTPLLFRGYDEVSLGRSVVCHLYMINSWEAEHEVAEKFVGSSTEDLEDIKVYLTRRESFLYAHSNFIKKGCLHPTKIATENKVSLVTLLGNLVLSSGHAPTREEVEEVQLVNATLAQYFVNEVAMPKGRDIAFFGGAMNISYVDP